MLKENFSSRCKPGCKENQVVTNKARKRIKEIRENDLCVEKTGLQYSLDGYQMLSEKFFFIKVYKGSTKQNAQVY